MSLIPYLLESELRPRRFRNPLISIDASPVDILSEVLDRPALRLQEYVRPWRNLSLRNSVGSTIKSDKDKFQVNLDVQHFKPDEISVKTSEGYIVIEGKHEEQEDDHGFVSRQFKRRYALPEGCRPDTVESKLSSDGVLTIVAPKEGRPGERSIPITHTGPVRRKAIADDDQVVENGAAVEEEHKSPQKKRSRR